MSRPANVCVSCIAVGVVSCPANDVSVSRPVCRVSCPEDETAEPGFRKADMTNEGIVSCSANDDVACLADDVSVSRPANVSVSCIAGVVSCPANDVSVSRPSCRVSCPAEETAEPGFRKADMTNEGVVSCPANDDVCEEGACPAIVVVSCPANDGVSCAMKLPAQQSVFAQRMMCLAQQTKQMFLAQWMMLPALASCSLPTIVNCTALVGPTGMISFVQVYLHWMTCMRRYAPCLGERNVPLSSISCSLAWASSGINVKWLTSKCSLVLSKFLPN